MTYRSTRCEHGIVMIPNLTKDGFCRASCPILRFCKWCARKVAANGAITRVAPYKRDCPWYEGDEA